MKVVSLWFSSILFYFSLFLWILYDATTAKFQFIFLVSWFNFLAPISFGIDSISLFFIVLTTFIIPTCLLANWTLSYTEGAAYFILCLFFIEFFLILAFTALDLLTFFFFFESVLIPMFFIVGVWGSRGNKIKAAYYFVLYTLFGSLFLLWAIFCIYLETGSLHIWTFLHSNLSFNKQGIIWICFFIAFAVKIPMFPLHIWLPEAHVEAPTIGSVILASLLLKLGGYGFLRYLLLLFPDACKYYAPFVFSLCLLGIVYASLSTFRQIDLKKIIAYSSIAHMNLVVAGLFSLNIAGILGAIMLMLAHGLVSGALFLLIGVLYERFHTRLIRYYGGVTQVMPLFAICFFFFNLANMGLPGTFNFVGELLILVGLFKIHPIIVLYTGLSVVLSAGYSLWLFNRVAFGAVRLCKIEYFDLTRREFFIYLPLILVTLVFGICPNILLDILFFSIKVLSLIFEPNIQSVMS